jgi:hypothetical protein
MGEGGMGDGHPGRDTRLDRSVALEVLPPSSRPIRSCASASSVMLARSRRFVIRTRALR